MYIDNQGFLFLDAKNLWNNLLEPTGAKSNWKRYSSLQCPTSERPFLATAKNSDEFYEYSDEDAEGHVKQIYTVPNLSKSLEKSVNFLNNDTSLCLDTNYL